MNSENLKNISDRYKIIEQIGIGGMSYVYKAVDTKTDMIVAIKVLKDELSNDEEFIKKFKEEAISSEKIKHKNVVRAYDVVDNGNCHFIVMEYIDGITLDKYIRNKGHLSNDETIDLSIQIAEGLKVAHKQGIIHRDVKPQNIVIKNDGTPKITDFGIARAVSSTTRNISIIGTVHYISPEQARNENIDFRSDIYSLGCTMYEMITGIVPFQGESPVAIIISHLREAIKLPSIDNKRIYKSLERIILKCTKILPENRYQNVNELIEDLKKAKLDKTGEYIKTDTYNGKNSDTVIISDSDMKIIKEISRNYANDKNRYNIYNMKKQKKYTMHIILSIAITAVVICLLFFLYMTSSRKNIDSYGIVGTNSQLNDKSIIFNNLKTSLPGVDILIARNLAMDYGISINIVEKRFDDNYRNNEIIEVLNEDLVDNKNVDVAVSMGSEILDFSNKKELNNTRFIDLVGQLNDRNLSFDVIEENDTKVPRGMIIGVNKKNSSGQGMLIFTISKGASEDMLLMPNLYNMTQEVATETLQKEGLTIGNIFYKPDSIVEYGHVLEQSIKSYREVEKGTIVDLTLSSGVNGEDTTYKNTEKWLSKINTSFIVTKRNSPMVNEGTMIIAIRLMQDTKEGTKYFELAAPREYRIGTTVSIVYSQIEGEPGVETGAVQIVDVENDEVLASYVVNFKKQKRDNNE